MRQQDFRTEAILQQLSQQLSTFTARYDDDRTPMDNFITATDANFSNSPREQAKSKEDMATFNNNLGDNINTPQTETSGRLTTLDARLRNMEEHGLNTNRTLSMLETKITQRNQEIG